MAELLKMPGFVAVLSLLVGTLLGLGSGLLLSSVRQRHATVLRMLDQYFEMRKEAASTISALTTLDLKTPLGQDARVRYREILSRLAYQHYDFLPQEVLDALVLLYMCLGDTKGRVYAIQGTRIRPSTDDESIELIREASLYENARLLASLALRSRDAVIRSNAAVSLHARLVLMRMNTYISPSNLLALARQLRKIRR